MPSSLVRSVLAALVALASCSSEPERPPSVLLISLDTLRADALSCYGNPRPTSPTLDALAAEGARFDEAMAHAPNTAPSHASLFTGVTPWTHRVENRVGDGLHQLPDEFVTLAEVFAERGYATTACTDGGSLAGSWNLDQGFEVYTAVREGTAAQVDRMLDHLDATADETRPRFLFLHSYETHQPTLPPLDLLARFRSDPDYDGVVREREQALRREARGRKRPVPRSNVLREGFEDFGPDDVTYLWDLYLASLASADREVGRFLDELAARGLDEDLWVIVTSDHGEEFGEHGYFGHRQLLYETLRVPLIVRPPRGSDVAWRGRVVDERVGLVDLHATLLDLADGRPGHAMGHSLLVGLETGVFPDDPVWSERAAGRDGEDSLVGRNRAAFAQDEALLLRAGTDLELQSLHPLPTEGARVAPGSQAPEALLVRRVAADGAVDFQGDEGHLPRLLELVDAVEDHLDRADALRAAVLGADPGEAGYAPLDPATLEELRALGYVDGDEVVPGADDPGPRRK